MTDYNGAFDDGLEQAARYLQGRADEIRSKGMEGSNTVGMMARIFEAEADAILALRRVTT